jgi:hypothetical protein
VFDVETRTWQFVKNGVPSPGSVSPGAPQVNRPCGLRPLNGVKPKLLSLAGNVTVPPALTVTADGDVPRSQWSVGSQPAVVEATPSHCSMYTCDPAVKPEALTVNDWGVPEASPGTVYGLADGVVMVPAMAGPAISNAPTAAPPNEARTRSFFGTRASFLTDVMGDAAVTPRAIQAGPGRGHNGSRDVFRKRSAPVHPAHAPTTGRAGTGTGTGAGTPPLDRSEQG